MLQALMEKVQVLEEDEYQEVLSDETRNFGMLETNSGWDSPACCPVQSKCVHVLESKPVLWGWWLSSPLSHVTEKSRHSCFSFPQRPRRAGASWERSPPWCNGFGGSFFLRRRQWLHSESLLPWSGTPSHYGLVTRPLLLLQTPTSLNVANGDRTRNRGPCPSFSM